MKKWTQAAEISFFRRVVRRSLRDRVRSSVTREELGVELLLLYVKSCQVRWLRHLFRMLPAHLPREVFQAQIQDTLIDYVSRLVWERFRILPEEVEEMSAEMEVWTSWLRLLPS